MNKKDIIKLIIYEYARQYNREIALYNALKPLNIYVNEECPLEEAYLEQILDGVNPQLVEVLLEFLGEGSVSLKPNKCAEWETVTELDRLIDIYCNDIMED